jgi:hypothetical protein
MRLGKGKVIIVAFVSLVTGMHAASASSPHRACGALRGHFAQTHFVQICHCHPKYNDSTRYREHLLAGFETEYDVEKWEKAHRQGLAQWGAPSTDRRCRAGL